MQRITHPNGVITYTFDSLAQLPLHVHVSTRHGGVSPAPWNTLNFSVQRGDTPERVLQNRTRLADALGIAVDAQVRCHQVHGTGVAKVDQGDANQWQTGVDSLVTDTVNLPLALVFADCVPVLLYDPQHHALGVCHAGWRGTLNGAAAATLWAMQAAYDTDPAALLACIGPSIGPQSYAVGQDVVDLAHVKLNNADQLFSYPNGQDQNPHFDLWQANVNQLCEAGVPLTHIEVSGIDTAQNTHDFFSHRAEKGQCGLFSMVAWLDAR
ncbi:MAG: peptidoglycan editing factor PgeF [Chloroflexota bacterium]|nr:peptidoglycan editing factor PgeF [Chloroflexota bacterium]